MRAPSRQVCNIAAPGRGRRAIGAAVCIAVAVAGTAARGDDAPGCSVAPRTCADAPFLAENAAAMESMMAGMATAPTGNVDADFTAMMIPHHQGAIDMAVAYLRYGTDPRLRRLAQEIVVEQQQEIVAMRLARGETLPPSAPAPTQPPSPASPPPEAASAPMQHPHPMAPASPTLAKKELDR